MKQYQITLMPEGRSIPAQEGQTIQQALQAAGVPADAPCGGRGTCGKCRCLVDGVLQLACQTHVTHDCTVELPQKEKTSVLTTGVGAAVQPDGETEYALAFDIGTTTVVAYLLDGKHGALLATASALNPQTAFGGDVISRIQHILDYPGTTELRDCIRRCLAALTEEAAAKAGLNPVQIGLACIVGNTAMHHLFLGIDPTSLTVPPYMPQVYERMEIPAEGILPLAPGAKIRMLPNIAGFVGADTVGCMAATEFDKLDKLTLMIDIGTNGEMVLGDRTRRVACSTAAGPAFEGAKIRFGMRGAPGAIDHVNVEDGKLVCSVIGGGAAKGICGSGLLDAVYALLQLEMVEESGRMDEEAGVLDRWETFEGLKAVRLEDGVCLTQKDVRELQLAKAAIRAGIELLMKKLGVQAEDIQQVFLAGAFGSYLRPASACGIGMIPPVLQEKIVPIGNAAGAGAQRCALRRSEFEHSGALAAGTEFIELASMPEFQDCYVDCLSFEEEE